MAYYHNEINDRIEKGYFPLKRLVPAPPVESIEIDFSSDAETYITKTTDPLPIVSLYMDFFTSVLSYRNGQLNRDILWLANDVDFPGIDIKDMTVLVNTCVKPEMLPRNGAAISGALSVCPIVTTADLICFFCACIYDNKYQLSKNSDDNLKLARNTWVYILHHIQETEYTTGLTIDVDSVDIPSADGQNLDSAILSLLLVFKKRDAKTDCLVELSASEKEQMDNLMRKRAQISQAIKEDMRIAQRCGEKTQDDWILFLWLLDEMSVNESSVIARILSNTSKRDKLQSISDYSKWISDLRTGQYMKDGAEIHLSTIIDSVYERITNAPSFSFVQQNDDLPFQLQLSAPVLVKSYPSTFNGLLIRFHHFRLDPSASVAIETVHSLLNCMENNLLQEISSCSDLETMIIRFHRVVSEYYNKKNEELKRLSFSRIQDAFISPHSSDIRSAEEQYILDALPAYYSRFKTNLKDVESFLAGEFDEGFGSRLAWIHQTNQEATAYRMVISIDIIYLFCNVLKIILKKPSEFIITDPQSVNRIMHELLRYEENLLSVYSNRDINEPSIKEYREEKGIDTIDLAVQEANEEHLRDQAFMYVLTSEISRLFEDANKNSIDDLLTTKTSIQREIQSCPDCDAKDQLADWIDDICSKICDHLVMLCQNRDDFSALKSELTKKLGEEGKILSSADIINSLVTAEMLFRRYATDENAAAGLDFSCISSMYYQAFEAAYNTLIWSKYANKLNALEYNGMKFVSFLYSCNTINDNSPFSGYLASELKDRKFYTFKDKKKHITTVNHTCTYGNFSRIIENLSDSIKSDSLPLFHFREYFAKEAGFTSWAELSTNKEYMYNCDLFIRSIEKSVDSRNKASHGGTVIDKSQCQSDKRTVLSDLEAVRSDSIGLIQQLLYLLSYKNGIDNRKKTST